MVSRPSVLAGVAGVLVALALPAHARHVHEPRVDIPGWNTRSLVIPLPCGQAPPELHFTLDGELSTGNAYLLLLAAWLSHLPDAGLAAAQLRAWGFHDWRFLAADDHGPTAYAGFHPRINLLAFRGSESTADYLIDGQFLQSAATPLGFAGAVHAGMLRKFSAMRAELEDVFRAIDRNTAPVVVTGHSLGGVMALFAALSLELRGRPVALLYTVGQPRPGNQAFAQFVRDLLGRRYVRLEGLRDITPQVPPTAHNADAFARLISERAPRLRAGLAAALRRLGYAALAGPAFLVGDDGSFERLDGRELTREASYWDELAHHFRTNLPLEQWLRPLVERFSEHRPRHYLCTLGRALATAGRW